MASKRSLFLTLAPEIRVLIYKLVLPYSTYYPEFETSDSPVRWHRGLCPSILFVNQQIYYEASYILYTENYFAVYLRHPRDARLPMNESRPDHDSFVLFSLIERSWAHPRNYRLSLSALQNRRNLNNLRKVYVSIPCFDDLIGVDAYLRRSSEAGFRGITHWLTTCASRGGHLSPEEIDRISYVYKYKAPIDEVGKMLQQIPCLDFLSIGVNRWLYNITFMEFLLEEILQIRRVKRARCHYVPEAKMGTSLWIGVNRYDPLLRDFDKALESQSMNTASPAKHLSQETEDVWRLLQAIRKRQSLQSAHEPGYLYLNPADVIDP